MGSSSRVCAAFVVSLLVAHARADEDDLARARFLDQQGVHAFSEGRFRDAMALFAESFKAGGPPTELWNVARCQLKLEDTEGARRTLESYLDHKNLSDDDRQEGKRLLDEIERRSSMLVIATSPQGAFVMIDGHVVGMTPLTSSLPPGPHEIKVTRSGTSDQITRHIDAHDGRPIVISAELGAVEHQAPKAPPAHARRFSAELGAFGVVSLLGGGAVVDGTAAPEMSFGYAAFASSHAHLGVGLRFRGFVDVWTTSGGVSNTIMGCTPPTDYTGFELVAMPTVFGALRVGKRIMLGARLGFGAAIYASGVPIGGDLFAPACAYGGSLAPDGYAALDVSIDLASILRLVLFPATLDLHAPYVGARSDNTVDATGPWVRLGFGAALAVDL